MKKQYIIPTSTAIELRCEGNILTLSADMSRSDKRTDDPMSGKKQNDNPIWGNME